MKEVKKMSVLRPLSKDLLKKMFLRTLYNEKENATDVLLMPDFVSIICGKMAEFFAIPDLIEEEYELCLDAVFELESYDYITNLDNKSSEVLKDLTPKGKKYVEEKLLNFQLPSIDIYKHITRDDLREEVVKDYLSGNYEESIMKAFSLLEERVKENTIVKPEHLEMNEVSNYYIARDGALKYTTFQNEEELASLRRIMQGTMLWFKDPENNTSISLNNAEAAAQIIVFANMHLNLIDQ